MIALPGLTFGAEHEWADWPLSTQLPNGYGRDTDDITIVNSNGIANDPSGKFYGYGGEINTPPTYNIQGQTDCLKELKLLLPTATINYRSNLHLHIRIPGLKEDLPTLKHLQKYIHQNMRKVLAVIQPLPKPDKKQWPDPEELAGATRRWRRRRVSHQTLLTPSRLEKQLSATTVEEFFRLEPPHDKNGKPQWQCQPRLCVNLRQLLETDTIEFRHFAGTMDEERFRIAFNWCLAFIEQALENKPIEPLLASYSNFEFPKFPEYSHWMEKRYRATVHDGTVPKDKIKENINKILEGTFE